MPATPRCGRSKALSTNETPSIHHAADLTVLVLNTWSPGFTYYFRLPHDTSRLSTITQGGFEIDKLCEVQAAIAFRMTGENKDL